VDAARDQLAAANCSVLAVAQARPEVLTRYLARQGWYVPLVGDPERVAYRVFGLERTGWLTFFRPRVLWGYFRGLLRGYGVKKPYAGEDVLQLGGDFLLDRHRRVRYTYRSADPVDRPSVPAILQALSSATPIAAEHDSHARPVDTSGPSG
jgi:peroxiredoxin